MVKIVWRYVKPFSSDTGTSRTDGRTDRFAISISRVSMLTRDKNQRYKLRPRSHSFTLTCQSSFHDNCNFITRMLFRDAYWLLWTLLYSLTVLTTWTFDLYCLMWCVIVPLKQYDDDDDGDDDVCSVRISSETLEQIWLKFCTGADCLSQTMRLAFCGDRLRGSARGPENVPRGKHCVGLALTNLCDFWHTSVMFCSEHICHFIFISYAK